MNENVIVITGGTRGIGRAIVKMHARLAYIDLVIFTGTDPAGVAACQTELRDRQGSNQPVVRGLVLDLADASSIAAFAAQVPKLGDLVLNAAICETAPLGAENGPEIFDRVVGVNLRGNFLLANALLPKMADGGRIVSIASQLGVVGRAGYSAYCASKAGLIGMTKVWARELGPRGITANAVCPGWVETDMTGTDMARIAGEEGEDAASYRATLEEQLDLRRMTESSEVAALVAFLLSPGASGITGRAIGMAGPDM